MSKIMYCIRIVDPESGVYHPTDAVDLTEQEATAALIKIQREFPVNRFVIVKTTGPDGRETRDDN